MSNYDCYFTIFRSLAAVPLTVVLYFLQERFCFVSFPSFFSCSRRSSICSISCCAENSTSDSATSRHRATFDRSTNEIPFMVLQICFASSKQVSCCFRQTFKNMKFDVTCVNVRLKTLKNCANIC